VRPDEGLVIAIIHGEQRMTGSEEVRAMPSAAIGRPLQWRQAA
jgi:hypothetical protein